MANPDLEQYLATLRGAGQDLGGAFERLAKNEQQQGLMNAYAGADELIQSGRIDELGSQLAQFGDPEILRSQLQRKVASQSQGPGMSAEFLQKTYKIDPTLAADIASRPADQQRELAKDIVQQRQFSQDMNFKQEGENRRTEQLYGTPAKWYGEVKKKQNEFNNTDKQYSSVKSALEQGTAPSDAVVFNFLARNVAGEKGPLSDQDREQFRGKYGEETYNKVVQYFTSEGKSTLTAPQRAAFKELVAMSVNNYETYKAQEINDLFSAGSNLPQIYKDGKFVDKNAKKYLRDFNVTEGVDADGLPVFKPLLRKTREDVASDSQGTISKPSGGQGAPGAGGQETEVTSLISQIKDPKVQALAQAALAKYAGGQIPPEVIARIKQAAGAQ